MNHVKVKALSEGNKTFTTLAKKRFFVPVELRAVIKVDDYAVVIDQLLTKKTVTNEDGTVELVDCNEIRPTATLLGTEDQCIAAIAEEQLSSLKVACFVESQTKEVRTKYNLNAIVAP